MHAFSSFLDIFSTSRGRQLFSSGTLLRPPGCLRIVLGASEFTSPASFGTTLVRSRQGSEWHHIPLPSREFAFKGPPTAQGCTLLAPVLRARGHSVS